MAFSKAYLYPEEKQITSAFFKALSHAARLQILEQLELEGPLSVKAIKEKHHLSNEALSDHFEILRKAGLVTCYERFPHTYYEINKENLSKARQYMVKFFAVFYK